MSDHNNSSTTATTQSDPAGESDFTKDVHAMITEHAPRRFAVVLEYGDQIDAKVHAWGIALDDAAYMTTVDGKHQYSMATADNAVKFAPKPPNVTPYLVWVDEEADD
ncbi:hypothetical protein [Kibdelosporangium aridum]|uniref:Uncharacterized protein n=1 Tax=Kibdelosporangium aridum TaxID=2030 RepID=A0A1Y5YC44_KIBAR|nr:hypothetical protein [Kibdelosporangium aridum]SMD27420.1 hypothetical protein SAMN05661093_11027 [Kibdelosporangium aridum]